MLRRASKKLCISSTMFLITYQLLHLYLFDMEIPLLLLPPVLLLLLWHSVSAIMLHQIILFIIINVDRWLFSVVAVVKCEILLLLLL